ncbi:uncharacterized protein FIBRA_01423 [Fibroporia radiculosa]|uniref:HIG1 domain-containing protein n=1 Tax=Fibroporia radiculosa TaxID=599839 RepID=J4GK66_9APHY|nr:uncharacterized protein FIBRA_01423 [Fibroporia radiculosa]CCL99405.1 predicted protein [Fibroporia radiculosa]
MAILPHHPSPARTNSKMKVVTQEEMDAHMRATIVGGAKGFTGGLAVALPISYALNRRWGYYRQLPPSLKAFGVIMVAVPSFVISAERAGLRFEKEHWTDLGKEELDAKVAREQARWESLSLSQKARDVAARHEYGFIGGAWAATMLGAFGYIMRNPYQTFPQKVVQARMWAQGLTIGILIAAGALTHAKRMKGAEVDEHGRRHIEPDHSWQDIIAQEEQHAKEEANRKAPPVVFSGIVPSSPHHNSPAYLLAPLSLPPFPLRQASRSLTFTCHMHKPLRSVSIAASLVGALFNFVCAARLLALWRSLGWESETEWEASGDVWRVDSVKIVWGLLSTYFAAAALACFVGLVGLTKTIPSFIRFYRDYSIADMAFVTFGTVFSGYTAFSTPYVRASVCEELSRHPDLMRDLVVFGVSLENCELWFEQVVVAVVGIMFILMVVRLHTLIALAKYHRILSRDISVNSKSHTGLRNLNTDSLHRIYLLPTPTSPPSASFSFNHFDTATHARRVSSDNIVVYAPVPVGGMSELDARKMNATEAWIPCRSGSGADSGSSSPRSHGHKHTRSASSHSHRRHHSVPRVTAPPREGTLVVVDEKAEPLFR